MCAQDCKDCADLWRRRRSCKNHRKLGASSETTHTFAPQRASDTAYRGRAIRITCTPYLCWASAACNVDHHGNQRTCFPAGPATEFDGSTLMLTGPRTACPRICCAGVATRPPCIATHFGGRVIKPVPFKPSPVLRSFAHQAKPARTTAPRLAAHPLSRQISTFARYSSTEQGSSAQMEGSGQGPVLKVRRGRQALPTCAGTSLCLVLIRMWCYWVVVTVMWRFCGDLAWTPCQGCGSPSSPRMYIPHTGISYSKKTIRTNHSYLCAIVLPVPLQWDVTRPGGRLLHIR